jgi:hypothetical protein
MKTLKVSPNEKNTIMVSKEFLPVDTRGLDAKNRITLKERWYKFVAKRAKVDSCGPPSPSPAMRPGSIRIRK